MFNGKHNLNSFLFLSLSLALSQQMLFGKIGLSAHKLCSRDASIPRGFVPANHLHFHLYNFIQLRCYCKKSAAISTLSRQIKSTSTHSIKIWQIPFNHCKKWRSLRYFFFCILNILTAFNIMKRNVAFIWDFLESFWSNNIYNFFPDWNTKIIRKWF